MAEYPPSDWTHFRRDCVWKGSKLYFRGHLVGEVVPDTKYPQMWRVKLPDGKLSDMVNLTRAKDAAVTLTAKRMIPRDR